MDNRVRIASGLAMGVMSVALCAPLWAQDASDRSPTRIKVLLSELTVDPPPGAPGTWVEIYNPTDANVDVGRLRVMSQDQTLASIPEGSMLPSKALLTIRWTDAAEGKTAATLMAKSFARDNSAELALPPVSLTQVAPEAAARRKGECALVGRSGRHDVLLDYVRFGGRRGGIDSQWRTKAAAQRLWPEEETIRIGIDPAPGEPCPPAGPLASARVFAARHLRGRAAWITSPLRQATPGRGNVLPPPILLSPWDGAAIATDQDLQISIGSSVDLSLKELSEHAVPATTSGPADGTGAQKTTPTDVPPFRIQIAKDPHFHEIVYDAQMRPRDTIEEGGLEPGRYYARVRMDVGHVSTDWSEASYFRYE